MTLEEANKVRDSLKELSPNAEDFCWGPTMSFAIERKGEALKIINREIKRLKNELTN
jgi:hypothetical protein